MRRALLIGLACSLAFVGSMPVAAAIECSDVLPESVHPPDLACIGRCVQGGVACVMRYIECPPTC